MTKVWSLDADGDGILELVFEAGPVVYTHAIVTLNGVPYVVCHNSTETHAEICLYGVDGKLAHTFDGHEDNDNWINSVVATPDGQHIISVGSYDRLVRVWHVASKALVSTMKHSESVDVVAVTPDGRRLLTAAHQRAYVQDGADTYHRVWRFRPSIGQIALENTFSELHTDEVTALVALPDNQHALSGSADKTVKLFNVNNGAVARTFRHHTSAVTSLALLPDGLRFVSGSDDKTACIAYHGLAPH